MQTLFVERIQEMIATFTVCFCHSLPQIRLPLLSIFAASLRVVFFHEWPVHASRMGAGTEAGAFRGLHCGEGSSPPRHCHSRCGQLATGSGRGLALSSYVAPPLSRVCYKVASFSLQSSPDLSRAGRAGSSCG